MKRKAFAMIAVLLLISLCFCSCSSVLDGLLLDDNSVHKPDDLVYRPDIIISRNYATITVDDTEYSFILQLNPEIYIPSDVKMYGAVVEGETVEDKQKSSDTDIVYTSESCTDHIWLITGKTIENYSVMIIPGHTEMYEKKEIR